MEETLIARLPGGRTAFFDLMWKRMSEQGDFPALSGSVQGIVEAMQDEDRNAADLTGAILSDFALTQKVIRLANSAMYSAIGGEITTITKAAMVLGSEAIGHLALSIRFIDTISDATPDTPQAKNEMAKALLAGDIARKVAVKANLRDSEEVVVCALMHHLGRLLLAFYFPEEWAQIQKMAAGRFEQENSVTAQVIGVTLDEIAQEAAKRWRLPAKIAHSMARPTEPEAAAIPGSPDWLKMVAGFAGEAAAVVAEGAIDKKLELGKLAARYGDALLVPAESIAESVSEAEVTIKEQALLEDVGASALHDQGKPDNSRERLASGVLDVARAVGEGISFGDAMNLVLETMYGSMGFHRVVAFLRDGPAFKARVGFGAGMPGVMPELAFPEAYAADVFHLALANSADVFISDASGPKAVSSLPQWFKAAVPEVRAFVLLPMSFNGRPVGLLYGDWAQGSTGMVEQSELALLKQLRDHLMQVLSPGRKS